MVSDVGHFFARLCWRWKEKHRSVAVETSELGFLVLPILYFFRFGHASGKWVIIQAFRQHVTFLFRNVVSQHGTEPYLNEPDTFQDERYQGSIHRLLVKSSSNGLLGAPRLKAVQRTHIQRWKLRQWTSSIITVPNA
jgi:hypothetical protein